MVNHCFYDKDAAPPGKQVLVSGTVCASNPKAKEIEAIWKKWTSRCRSSSPRSGPLASAASTTAPRRSANSPAIRCSRARAADRRSGADRGTVRVHGAGSKAPINGLYLAGATRARRASGRTDRRSRVRASRASSSRPCAARQDALGGPGPWKTPNRGWNRTRRPEADSPSFLKWPGLGRPRPRPACRSSTSATVRERCRPRRRALARPQARELRGSPIASARLRDRYFEGSHGWPAPAACAPRDLFVARHRACGRSRARPFVASGPAGARLRSAPLSKGACYTEGDLRTASSSWPRWSRSARAVGPVARSRATPPCPESPSSRRDSPRSTGTDAVCPGTSTQFRITAGPPSGRYRLPCRLAHVRRHLGRDQRPSTSEPRFSLFGLAHVGGSSDDGSLSGAPLVGVVGGPVGDRSRHAHFLFEARHNGSHLTVIDPQYTPPRSTPTPRCRSRPEARRRASRSPSAPACLRTSGRLRSRLRARQQSDFRCWCVSTQRALPARARRARGHRRRPQGQRPLPVEPGRRAPEEAPGSEGADSGRLVVEGFVPPIEGVFEATLRRRLADPRVDGGQSAQGAPRTLRFRGHGAESRGSHRGHRSVRRELRPSRASDDPVELGEQSLPALGPDEPRQDPVPHHEGGHRKEGCRLPGLRLHGHGRLRIRVAAQAHRHTRPDRAGPGHDERGEGLRHHRRHPEGT